MAKPGLPSLLLPARILPEEPKLPPPKSALIAPGKEIKDDKVQGISKRLVVGYSETIGRRKTMEDKLVIFGSFRTKDDEDYFAVFDGHNGYKAAEFCATSLHVKLAQKLDIFSDPITCFKETFVESNFSLKSVITEGGTTAVIALFRGEELYIANTGDSRAVLSHKKKAIRVTTDHKPVLPEEKERIERAGGYVDHKGTITGSLAVSRSLGDFGYYPFITCDPDVFGPFLVFDTNHNYQFLILACDGLWDVVTDQEAVDIALLASNPQEAAIKLQETATEKNSKDNISVVVIFFPHFKPSTSHIPVVKESKSTKKSDSPSKTNGSKNMIRVSSTKTVGVERKPPKRTTSIKSTKTKRKVDSSSSGKSNSGSSRSGTSSSTGTSASNTATSSGSGKSSTGSSTSTAGSSTSTAGSSSAAGSSPGSSKESLSSGQSKSSENSTASGKSSGSNSNVSKSGQSGSSNTGGSSSAQSGQSSSSASSKSGNSAASNSPSTKLRQSKTMSHSKTRSSPNSRNSGRSEDSSERRSSPTVDKRKESKRVPPHLFDKKAQSTKKQKVVTGTQSTESRSKSDSVGDEEPDRVKEKKKTK